MVVHLFNHFANENHNSSSSSASNVPIQGSSTFIITPNGNIENDDSGDEDSTDNSLSDSSCEFQNEDANYDTSSDDEEYYDPNSTFLDTGNIAITQSHLVQQFLVQQFLVDGFTIMESQRLNYICKHQKKLRVSKYYNLAGLEQSANTQGSNKGKRVVLPSTYVGSRRSPAVERMYFHLEGDNSVYYIDYKRIDEVLDKPTVKESMFISWMEANKTYPEAKNLTYSQFVSKFVYEKGY
ncbi:hypothetical protein KIW84_061293 [Lathyrus oleraceus]|uniref:Helitron helicase-like domain-containing protein n=1 Tax=Pisum sativum TaxID=3888 RepID=A0A9D5A478_PEA|nr:hypothetical protein KIW84_061293 [Pisum sativum]